MLGTPDESTWPGVSRYPDYKDTFPKWPARSLAELVPTLEPAGIEVLSLMLRYARPSHGATKLLLMMQEVRHGVHFSSLVHAARRYDPQRRVTAKQLLQHDYFADVQHVHDAQRLI